MSNRKKSGERVNHPHQSKHPDTKDIGDYSPPVLANAGNVIRESYDAKEVMGVLEEHLLGVVPAGDVIHCIVGGGHMGHPLAHANEAPFPVKLAAFFVRSYCPPGDVVLDPFCGSGTTLQAAMEAGRQGLGIDVRPTQAQITQKRLRTVTPSLF